ncbi:MAG: EscU/YscU/HrcU family type III secretion system export apparatus switch protein [Treponema sp.]|nr:EscU/YscU/HrcU family type III secretion system export apparatus switch protein [Treponema sp.]
MAAEDEGRTEEPSEFRLEKARKEGRVAKSQEISAALILLLSVLLLIALSKWLLQNCYECFTYYFNRCHNPDVQDPNLVTEFYILFFKMIIPTSLVAVVAAILANLIQTRGFIFSWKPLEPKFSNIVPKFGEYLKKTIFSGKGLFNIAKSIGKVAIIYTIAFFLIRKDLFTLLEIISNGQILSAVGKIARMCAQLLIIVSVLFLIISIPDYFVNRKEFMESMKMTKTEVKQEFKELEGDPEVKGRLQQMQRDLLSQNIPKAVSESDVVITNPTHYAVALKYDEKEAPAPMVTAKGEGQTALYIKRIAKENNIPIEENRPVARGLYTDVKIGAIIPQAYFRVISLIYTHLLNKDSDKNK